MSARLLLGAIVLGCAMLGTGGLPLQALAQQAQAGSSHEVRRGDTLFGVARKARYDGVTLNQMILAIWRANQSAFPGGNINLLEVGTVLIIPARDVIAALDPAEAVRFRARIRETGITPVVSHASYLINLATTEPTLREQSIAALVDELDRAGALGLLGVVIHPGTCTAGTEKDALRLVADAIRRLFESRKIRTTDVAASNTNGDPPRVRSYGSSASL